MPNLRAIHSIAAAWILSVAFDLFLHGGLLARLYMAPSPFLLPLEEAFHRIPLGYAAFLGLTIALYGLLARLGVRGWRAGMRYGVIVGAAAAGTPLKRIWVVVAAAAVALVITTITMQSLGLAPAMKAG